MSNLLLTGPAGSGKTHRILNEFVEALRRAQDPLQDDYFLILPSAEHVDRVTMLVLQRGLPGFFKRRITTLSDFIRRRFSLSEACLASSSARFMILREVLSAASFPPFESVQSSPGFSKVILQFFSELKESLIRPEDFRAQMNQMKRIEPELAVKYEALAALFESYETSLQKQGLLERQDLYWLLKKRASKQPSPRQLFKKIWVDGFFDFTPLQLAYLGCLTETGGEIVLTLTKDAGQKRASVFHAAIQTEESLKRLGFKIEHLNATSQRFAHPAIQSLERNLFSGQKKEKNESSQDSLQPIRIFESVGVQGEIEMIAREVHRLVRDQNMRFSECAILFRQIGAYEPVLKSVFERYQIPLEIHEREQSFFSPWLHTALLFLKIFSEGWQRNDLIEFLKSPYVQKIAKDPDAADLIYRLEHTSARRGISKGREKWLEFWNLSKDPELDQGKGVILNALAEAEDRLRKEQSAVQTARLLKQILCVEWGMGEDTSSSGKTTPRDRAGRERFEVLLEEVCQHLTMHGKEESGFEAFCSHFAQLVELDLYSVHAGDKNRVQVYDISHARQKEYRVVFVAGLLEKAFPLQIKEDPVLSDWERQLFNSGAQSKLALKLPRQSIERYFFYLAVTRASHQVILTYPRLDLEGKESLPSFYVDEVKTQFQGKIPVNTQDLSRPYLHPQDAVSWEELEHSVMGGLWHAPQKEEPMLLALTNRILEKTESREIFRRAFYEIQAKLEDPVIAAGNYFRVKRLSPTRLEEYAKCHFRYFASKVLKLQDPQDDTNSRHAGIIRHKVMEEFFASRVGMIQDPISEEQIQKFVETSFRRALEKNPLIYEKRYQHLLEEKTIRDELRRAIQKEIDRLKKSQLQPGYFELEFGPKSQKGIPSLKIQDGAEGIEISGIIDRIDFDPAGKFALVVDYKPSAVFTRSDLDFGISLQLPIYIKVVEDLLKMQPVGAELYAIKKLKPTGFYHAEHAPSRILFSARSQYSDKDFKTLVEFSMDFIRMFARDMRAMNIEVRPRKCEDYCQYSAVCRIQKWRLDEIKEELKKQDQERKDSKNQIPNPEQFPNNKSKNLNPIV